MQSRHCLLVLLAISVALKREVDRVQEILIAERLRQEHNCASFHRPHGHRAIAMYGDEDDRRRNIGPRQLVLKVEAAPSRQPGVEYQARRTARQLRIQEFLRRSEGLDPQPRGAEKALQRLPQG
ncbi:MAG: hypothetical protein JWM91_845 [Rhodospirillales bacterium]|nr:hypothetical protein [Rhodospirillales bacterium]